MGKHLTQTTVFFLLVTAFLARAACGQNDVMMQGYHFNVPVDIPHRDGTWWDNLASKSGDIKEAGFTGIWTPPPSKGINGIEDIGYSIFSHFDLGNYDLKGTVETRYGSRAELENMVASMHANHVEVYADMVLHMLIPDYRSLEVNPIVKNYITGEANNGTHIAFQTNDVVWRLPSAPPGEYHVQIKGYNLPCTVAASERAYEIYANWTNPDPFNPLEPSDSRRPAIETEPNDGNGNFNQFRGSGSRMLGHIDPCGDIDEYSLTVTNQADLNIVLTSMTGLTHLGYGDQVRGYRILKIVGPQGDVTESLQVLTKTNINYAANQGVTFTGPGEQNWIWDYTYFHPNSDIDYIETWDGMDGIIPRARFWTNDIDTSDQRAAERLKYWGQWLTDQIGYDGYRMDSVNLYEESFASSWINAMPRKADGSQRFVVGEYATVNKVRQKEWVAAMAGQGADAKVFDYALKYDLNRLANGSSSTFNMTELNHAGLIRDNNGQNIAASQVVTFSEIHDTARPSNWVFKDWQLPYAYLLFAEGRPCVLYAHFFTTALAADGAEETTPVSLQQDIRKLISIRRQQLDGDMTVLSEIGNPAPSNMTANVYVARRRGDRSADRPGGILVINNNELNTGCLTVDNSPSGTGYENWAGKTLVDLTGAEPETSVDAGGRVMVCAPPRGYSVYAPVEWMNNRSSDFDRDGLGDPAVWRPSEGKWYALQNSSYIALNWGLTGDKPVSADYDGDRIADIAVWRPSNGTWYILLSGTRFDPASAIIVPLGQEGDIPMPADFDGDGKVDAAVFRPQTGDWYIFNSSDRSTKIVNWGVKGDRPVAADYDGDGRADVAVYRPSNGTWYIQKTGVERSVSYQFGSESDQPVPADYDGDRKTDLSVYRPSTGVWYILGSKDNSVRTTSFGTAGDRPVPSDFDGDGKADIAVWRPSEGNWYVTRSSDNSFFAVSFGQNGDMAIRPAAVPE